MNISSLEMYAVAIYDRETEVLTLTKEAAHSPLVAARVALANFCLDEVAECADMRELRRMVQDYDLEVEVVCLASS